MIDDKDYREGKEAYHNCVPYEWDFDSNHSWRRGWIDAAHEHAQVCASLGGWGAGGFAAEALTDKTEAAIETAPGIIPPTWQRFSQEAFAFSFDDDGDDKIIFTKP